MRRAAMPAWCPGAEHNPKPRWFAVDQFFSQISAISHELRFANCFRSRDRKVSPINRKHPYARRSPRLNIPEFRPAAPCRAMPTGQALVLAQLWRRVRHSCPKICGHGPDIPLGQSPFERRHFGIEGFSTLGDAPIDVGIGSGFWGARQPFQIGWCRNEEESLRPSALATPTVT